MDVLDPPDVVDRVHENAAPERLALHVPDQVTLVATRDKLAAAAGRVLYPLHGAAGATARWILEKESKDIKLNIQIVAQ